MPGELVHPSPGAVLASPGVTVKSLRLPVHASGRSWTPTAPQVHHPAAGYSSWCPFRLKSRGRMASIGLTPVEEGTQLRIAASQLEYPPRPPSPDGGNDNGADRISRGRECLDDDRRPGFHLSAEGPSAAGRRGPNHWPDPRRRDPARRRE